MENELLQSVNLLGAGLTSAYALANRECKIKSLIGKTIPKISKAYNKISPFLEHAIWGYAVTSLGYYAQGNDTIKEFMLNSYPNSPTELYGLIGAGTAVATDLGWEASQAVERKKIKPSQFIGTCVGSLAAILLNNK